MVGTLAVSSRIRSMTVAVRLDRLPNGRGSESQRNDAATLAGGGERLRNVIVPGQILFVDQRPHQTESSGDDAEQTGHLAHAAPIAIRHAAVEIHQAQPGEA